MLRRLLVFQLFVGLGTGIFVLLFNLYLLALGYREDVIGLAAGLNTLGQGLAALLAGWLVNRLGAPRLMTGALLLFTVASTGQVLVSQRPSIAIWAFVIGIATAWLTVPVISLLAEHLAPEARAEANALTFAVQNLALTIGTLLGGLLPLGLARSGLDTVERIQVALLIGIVVGALGLLPLAGIRWHTRVAGPQSGTTLLGPELGATPWPVRRTIWGYAGAATLLSVGTGAVIPFINVYLARLGADPGAIGLILAATGAVGSFCALAAPRLARRFGALTTATVLRLVPVPFALGLAAFPALGLVIALQAARQIGASMAWPVELALLTERVPGRALAGAFGLRIAAWNFSWAAISVVAGQLIVRGGYNAPLYILAVATALGTGAVWWALRPTTSESSASERSTRHLA